jgi:hypothetical protein
MKKITFNEWQEHLTKELQKNYRKLKLIQNEKFQELSRKQSKYLSRV